MAVVNNEIDDRDRAVLIKDVCLRLGKWGASEVYQPFSASTMEQIRLETLKLLRLLEARELSLYRQTYGRMPTSNSEEG